MGGGIPNPVKMVTGAVSGVVKAVETPITATVGLVSNVASGKNVGSSLGTFALQETTAAAAPVTFAAKDSGLTDAVSKIPVLGGMGSTYLNAGYDIASGQGMNDGLVKRSTATNYIRSGAELGALGYAAASAPAIYGAAAANPGTTALVGTGALSIAKGGSVANAAIGVGAGLADDYVPGSGDVLGGVANGLGGSTPGQGAHTPGSFVGPVKPATMNGVPPAVALGNQTPSPIYLAMLAGAGWLAINAIKKGHIR